MRLPLACSGATPMLNVPAEGAINAPAAKTPQPEANGFAPKAAFGKAPKVEAWAGAG